MLHIQYTSYTTAFREQTCLGVSLSVPAFQLLYCSISQIKEKWNRVGTDQVKHSFLSKASKMRSCVFRYFGFAEYEVILLTAIQIDMMLVNRITIF